MAIVINKHGHRLNDFKYIKNIEEVKDIQGIWGGNAILLYKGKLVEDKKIWNR